MANRQCTLEGVLPNSLTKTEPVWELLDEQKGRVAITQAGSTRTLGIIPLSDGLFEDAETVVVSLVAQTPPPYVIDSSKKEASITIAGQARITKDRDAQEGEDAVTTGTFTVTVQPAPAAELVIPFAVTKVGAVSYGTNLDAADFDMSKGIGKLRIPASSTTAAFVVTPKDDQVASDLQSLTLELGGGNASAGGTSLKMDIKDDEPTISIESVSVPIEGGKVDAFKVSYTRPGRLTPLNRSVVVSLQSNLDSSVVAVPASVEIPKGQTSAFVSVEAKGGSGDKLLMVSVDKKDHYYVSSNKGSANSTISAAVPTVTALGDFMEGQGYDRVDGRPSGFEITVPASPSEREIATTLTFKDVTRRASQPCAIKVADKDGKWPDVWTEQTLVDGATAATATTTLKILAGSTKARLVVRPAETTGWTTIGSIAITAGSATAVSATVIDNDGVVGMVDAADKTKAAAKQVIGATRADTIAKVRLTVVKPAKAELITDAVSVPVRLSMVEEVFPAAFDTDYCVAQKTDINASQCSFETSTDKKTTTITYSGSSTMLAKDRRYWFEGDVDASGAPRIFRVDGVTTVGSVTRATTNGTWQWSTGVTGKDLWMLVESSTPTVDVRATDGLLLAVIPKQASFTVERSVKLFVQNMVDNANYTVDAAKSSAIVTMTDVLAGVAVKTTGDFASFVNGKRGTIQVSLASTCGSDVKVAIQVTAAAGGGIPAGSFDVGPATSVQRGGTTDTWWVTIPANTESVDITVGPTATAAKTNAGGTVTIAMVSSPITNKASCTLDIRGSTGTVTVASQEHIFEGPSDRRKKGTIVFKRGGTTSLPKTTVPITLQATFAGTATCGTKSVPFKAGEEKKEDLIFEANAYEASVAIDPPTDNETVDDPRTVTVTPDDGPLLKRDGDLAKAIEAGTKPTLSVIDDERPVVSFYDATYQIARGYYAELDVSCLRPGNREPVADVEVDVEVTSTTAVAKRDYTVPSSLTLKKGAKWGTLKVEALGRAKDDKNTGDVTLTVTLKKKPGTDLWDVGLRPSVTITIVDLPVVSLVQPTKAVENGAAGSVVLGMNKPWPFAVAVAYEISGSAKDRIASPALSGTITIPPGQTVVPIAVTVKNDDIRNAYDQVTVTLTAPAEGEDRRYTLGAAAKASLTIVDDEVKPLVAAVTQLWSPDKDGTYAADAMLSIEVWFTQDVVVTGSPYLLLNCGLARRRAVYASGSGTGKLAFSYTVDAADASPDLDVVDASSLVLEGGARITAKNADSRVDLTLPAPGAVGSLSQTKNLKIQGTMPGQNTDKPTAAFFPDSGGNGGSCGMGGGIGAILGGLSFWLVARRRRAR